MNNREEGEEGEPGNVSHDNDRAKTMRSRNETIKGEQSKGDNEAKGKV